VQFWQKKFDENLRRDVRVRRSLRRLGWRVVVVWECQTVSRETLSIRLERALSREHRASPAWALWIGFV